MSAFADLVRFLPVAGGTGDWVVSSAVGGCQTPALANVLNGISYKVYAVSSDLTQWEVSTGAYNSGTTTFPRTTVLYNSSGTGTATGQSGAGTKISFNTIPQVSVVAIAEDLISVETTNAFTTTQQAQARSNIVAVGAIHIQTFSSTGTYTPNANLIYAVIECWGGGGGGGSETGTVGFTLGASGGAAGNYARKTITSSAIGISKSVTVGAGGGTGTAGGQTSVGVLCVANGGNPGSPAPSSGGTPGAAGTGDINSANGAPGMPGEYASTTLGAAFGGAGGSSLVGAGGNAVAVTTSSVGNNATGFGAGGGGAAVNNTGTGVNGGSGSGGLVIVTEYCTA